MPFDETRFAVFSAHAEVVPYSSALLLSAAGILRARGGSSLGVVWVGDPRPYSPRTRR